MNSSHATFAIMEARTIRYVVVRDVRTKEK
jgi:hypothetical protein